MKVLIEEPLSVLSNDQKINPGDPLEGLRRF
jgi:hypothetical protein